MNWSRVPTLGGMGSMLRPQSSSYLSDGGLYRVSPAFAQNRRGRKLKSTVWRLYEGGKAIGAPFASARLAKAFAEALAGLGDDRRARHHFIREGGEWCYQKEQEWRRTRDDARFARYREGAEA